MRKLILPLLLTTFTTFLFSPHLHQVHAQQKAHSLNVGMMKEITVDYQYLLHIPKNDELKVDGKLPLIVFLHGAGERGDSINLVKVHGPPKIVDNQPEFPFAVLSPQCKAGEMWDPASLDLLIEMVTSTNPIDRSRVYLTGLSMGGRGTWDLAFYNPSRFAAIAPICGWGEPFIAAQLKDMPTWVFHGALDFVVPLEESSLMVLSLKRAGSSKVKFTVYPEANHDSWTKTYNNAKLYEWMLQQRK